MKQLHFLKHGRGHLYVCDEGNYRFQVYQISRTAFEVWAASVHRRHARRGSFVAVAEAPPCRSKAEAIQWCATQEKVLREAGASKAEQKKQGVRR